jgi:hypothetical protein
MKYLKKFENFDLGRFSDEEENKNFMNQPDENEQAFDQEEEEIFNSEEEADELEEREESEEENTYEDEREEEKGRVWGDEVVERKKINAGFQAYLDKKAGKKADKKDDKDDKKEEKGRKKAKPDFLDLDKDGDKKEPMKKAAKEAKDKKKSKVNENFWNSIFGKPSVNQAAHDSLRGQGFSHRGKDKDENNYVMFNGQKFYQDQIQYDDYQSTKPLPRVEGNILIIANPAWSL